MEVFFRRRPEDQGGRVTQTSRVALPGPLGNDEPRMVRFASGEISPHTDQEPSVAHRSVAAFLPLQDDTLAGQSRTLRSIHDRREFSRDVALPTPGRDDHPV